MVTTWDGVRHAGSQPWPRWPDPTCVLTRLLVEVPTQQGVRGCWGLRGAKQRRVPELHVFRCFASKKRPGFQEKFDGRSPVFFFFPDEMEAYAQ